MKSSSDRTVAVLHFCVALALALLQPRLPLPKSAGVRVAVQTSVVLVMLCLGPTRSGGGSSFLGASRGASCSPDEGAAGVVALIALDWALFPSVLIAMTA